jgi:DNA polymerase III epsilon subunit-like protein
MITLSEDGISVKRNETYISIDVETAGPNPAKYALLSIGACNVFEPHETFYVELQPDREAVSTEALQISGLNMDELREHGLSPEQAMGQFADWVKIVTPQNSRAVFVAFNAPFDWMFVNDYFHRYLKYNPFGHSALDMKAFYMGLRGVAWSETGMDAVSENLLGKRTLSHNALQDARDQAELFREMLEEAKRRE